MTALPVPIEPVADKRHFPHCPFCRWRPSMRRLTEGVAVLARLVELAKIVGQALTRQELMTPVSDYKCPKCKSIVPVTVGDLLRN